MTVADTVQPEIKFYYEDDLHLSNLGISKLCDILLSKLYEILGPTSHKSRVSSRQNRKAFIRGSSRFKQYSGSNSKQAHGTHSSLKIGCRNVQYFKTALLYIKSDMIRKSFVFSRQHSNWFSRRVNALWPRNQPINTAIGMVMHDFHSLKTMIFHSKT